MAHAVPAQAPGLPGTPASSASCARKWKEWWRSGARSRAATTESFDVAGACDVVSPGELAEHLLDLLFASVNIPVAVTNGLY